MLHGGKSCISMVFLKPQNIHTSLIRNWGFEAVVALDWDDDWPGSRGSCDEPDLTEKLRMREFLGCKTLNNI